MQKPTEPRWLTYAELAELMEASTEAARAFANRLELRKQRGNDGKARVYVEPDVLASRLTVHHPVTAWTVRPVTGKKIDKSVICANT